MIIQGMKTYLDKKDQSLQAHYQLAFARLIFGWHSYSAWLQNAHFFFQIAFKWYAVSSSSSGRSSSSSGMSSSSSGRSSGMSSSSSSGKSSPSTSSSSGKSSPASSSSSSSKSSPSTSEKSSPSSSSSTSGKSSPSSKTSPSTPSSKSTPSTPSSKSTPSTPTSKSSPSTPTSKDSPSTPTSKNNPSTPSEKSASSSSSKNSNAGSYATSMKGSQSYKSNKPVVYQNVYKYKTTYKTPSYYGGGGHGLGGYVGALGAGYFLNDVMSSPNQLYYDNYHSTVDRKTMPNQDPVQYEQQVDNSLSSSWVSSEMMESIKIGKGDKPVMGDIFQADWMSENASHTLPTLSISSLAPTQAFAPAPASVATDNATAIAWTFGHCPLIIPDQSFEGSCTLSLS